MDDGFNEAMEYAAIGIIAFMSLINFAVMIKLSARKAVHACRKRKI